MLIFIILVHMLTCIWVIAAQFNDPEKNPDSWMDDFTHLSTSELYITSVYFTVTTVTTVGYGDINGANPLERTVSICIMIIGVISFSFATGSLSSIL